MLAGALILGAPRAFLHCAFLPGRILRIPKRPAALLEQPEHNKRNDVVQIGNDRVSRTEHAPMQRAGYDIKRALETARN